VRPKKRRRNKNKKTTAAAAAAAAAVADEPSGVGQERRAALCEASLRLAKLRKRLESADSTRATKLIPVATEPRDGRRVVNA